jgi:hypothetical protein
MSASPDPAPAPKGRPEPEIFRRRTVIALAVVSSASLLVALILSALSGDLAEVPTAGPSAYSRSALGYAALVRLLAAGGVPSLVSRHGSVEKAGPDRPLFLAEPSDRRAKPSPSPEDDDGEADAPRAEDMAAAARARGAPLVLVLPKWTGRPMRLKTGWIDHADLRPAGDAADALGALTYRVTASAIVRLDAPPSGLRSRLPGGELPTLPRPQLLRRDAIPMDPLIEADEGVLVAHLRELDAYVIADPDLVNTMGLARGDNAAVAQRFFAEHLHAKGLVVDETVHGFGRAPSLMAELFDFPLALCTLHFAGLFALLLWATMGRFGKPEAMPPRLPPGKLALVDNTAELLGQGGFSAHGLRRYAQMILREGAAACAVPPGLDEREQVARLVEISRRRGLTADVGALHAEARSLETSAVKGRGDARRALSIARALHHWHKELLRGNR